jgi:2-amino-4-hydroxy-6-hydroxymethyldihydropteridine diphosphokinase
MNPALIYISLGTNLGDRMANLRLAHAALLPEFQLLVYSSVYETEPWGYPDQPPFLNQVVKAHSRLSPPAMLAALKEIEKNIGRRPTFRYGPRLIDLDILFYNNLVLDTPVLTIPHPKLAERAFVLVPLAEIAPDLVHPGLGLTMHQLLAQVGDKRVAFYESSPSKVGG